MIVIFSPSYQDPRQKLIHAGFSNSQKPLVVVSNDSWLIFEKLRFMTDIWLLHMQYAYIMPQNFMTIFLLTKFFESAYANFQISIFSKIRGRNIFWSTYSDLE